MKFVDKYDAGRFCWYELGTTDPAAAEQFYGALFGWQAAHVPMGEERYTLAQIEGRDVAGIYKLNAEQIGMGIPPHWLLYVAVADADETTAKAQAAGGSVLMGPMDVMDVGRMSVLKDPAGAVFAVWQALQHPGSQVIDAEGTWCWSELATSDVAGSKDFYAKVFGWSAATAPMGPMEYTMFQNGVVQAAGMLGMTAEYEGIPPHWMIYWKVSDLDASLRRLSEAGGARKHGPTSAAGVGRFALCADPQGAPFSLIQLGA